MKIVLAVAFAAIITTPCVAAPEINPNAITCQKAQPIPNMAMVRDKPVCRSNAEWARINAARAALPESPTMAGGGEILAVNNR